MITIPLSDLNNQELLTFGKRMSKIFSSVNTEQLGIKLYVDNFEERFSVYTQSFNKEEVSAAEISQKDAYCDDYYIALRAHVRN